jgi:hypothetical protein
MIYFYYRLIYAGVNKLHRAIEAFERTLMAIHFNALFV